MAKLNITKKDLEALNFKANLAYNVLQDAVTSPNQEATPWILSSANNLYQHDLGALLEEIARRGTSREIMDLNKGGKRASGIEAFILQYVLMHNSCNQAADINIQVDKNDNMGGLKAYLDAEDDLSSSKGNIFRAISREAARLRKNGKYDLILNAMDYVRGKYSQK